MQKLDLLGEQIDALVAERDRLLEAAGIAIEAFTQVEDDVRYDPVFWSAMEPLRHTYADINARRKLPQKETDG